MRVILLLTMLCEAKKCKEKCPDLAKGCYLDNRLVIRDFPQCWVYAAKRWNCHYATDTSCGPGTTVDLCRNNCGIRVTATRNPSGQKVINLQSGPSTIE